MNSSYKSNNSTLIKEIIGEMKYKFNKLEQKNGFSKSDTVEVKNDMDVNQMQESCDADETFSEKDELRCDEATKHHHTETVESKCIESEAESPAFKKPKDESQIKIKGLSPGKRSLRQKSDKIKNTIKRSSRRRSKDTSESILQSAIARKEKSYNESNKPQRLSRQVKSTRKMEHTKLDKNTMASCDIQSKDIANTSNDITKKYLKSKRKTRNTSNNFNESRPNLIESIFDNNGFETNVCNIETR